MLRRLAIGIVTIAAGIVLAQVLLTKYHEHKIQKATEETRTRQFQELRRRIDPMRFVYAMCIKERNMTRYTACINKYKAFAFPADGGGHAAAFRCRSFANDFEFAVCFAEQMKELAEAKRPRGQ